jgi:hypothetical protein
VEDLKETAHKLLFENPLKCKNCGEKVELNAEEEKKIVSQLFVRMILRSDKSCFHYTGVPTVVFLTFLFQWVSSVLEKVKYWGGHNRLQSGRIGDKGRRSYKISKFEAMILTLVKIRTGMDNTHLSFLFGISASHVSRIFTTWVNVLNQCMKPLLLYPSKELCRDNLPDSFKHFPKTRCIIDCTELRIEKSFSPRTQKITYSNYKHHNTGKILVAIMPSGAITFLSKVYVGSVSDRSIVEKSGFLSRLEERDDIMADRGFNVRDLMLQKKATLNIPAFSRGATLSSKSVKLSRKIASVRIHVERAIGRMKTFKMLSGILSLKVRFLLNQILTIVAVLCNMQQRLC